MPRRPVLVVVCAVLAWAWPPEVLIWHEEFDSLDTGTWSHMVSAVRGNNREFQYYRNNRKNSYVRDGILYIRPTLTADEYGEEFLTTGKLKDPQCNLSPCESAAGKDIVLPIQSARMRTVGSFAYRYGRLAVRAQMPRGDWIWPAIWLKPVENQYGAWPASGEMDLIEVRSNKKYTSGKSISQGISKMASTLHFGPNASYNIWRPTHWEKTLEGTGQDFADDFHVFGMEWSPYCISFTLDGKTFGAMPPPEGGFWKLGGFDKNPGGSNIWDKGGRMAPFDREFFIILNVATGGNFFPDGFRNSPHPRPWNWSSPHPMKDFWDRRDWWLPTWNGEESAMKVDYIRVFALTPRRALDNACPVTQK